MDVRVNLNVVTDVWKVRVIAKQGLVFAKRNMLVKSAIVVWMGDMVYRQIVLSCVLKIARRVNLTNFVIIVTQDTTVLLVTFYALQIVSMVTVAKKKVNVMAAVSLASSENDARYV